MNKLDKILWELWELELFELEKVYSEIKKIKNFRMGIKPKKDAPKKTD